MVVTIERLYNSYLQDRWGLKQSDLEPLENARMKDLFIGGLHTSLQLSKKLADGDTDEALAILTHIDEDINEYYETSIFDSKKDE